MQGKTKKTIFIFITIAITIAAAIGYTMFNKKHFNVQNATPAAQISAIELHQIFTTDSALAKNKFIGDVTNSINKDLQGNTIILLKTSTNGAFINCTMEGEIAAETIGSKIIVKGICTGYNFDADMGIPGDVIVTRCFITK
jgi:archaellum component FlaF (FlaF/FlaG flagellin family)